MRLKWRKGWAEKRGIHWARGQCGKGLDLMYLGICFGKWSLVWHP